MNPELSHGDKFNYLKSTLSGKPAAAIAGLPPASRYYDDAIKILKGRFGNDTLLLKPIHFGLVAKLIAFLKQSAL